MPEFRQDPLSGSWVIVAANRAGRPQDYQDEPASRPAIRCPFCRGSEAETPAATASYYLPDQPHQWQVRVVPNKFPAVQPDAEARAADRLSSALAAAGVHEVIIESPEHLRSLTELSGSQRLLVLQAYRDRLQHVRSQHRWKYGLVFKNLGPSAGASLEHLHSQLIATSLLPDKIAREVQLQQQHHRQHGCGLVESLLERELEHQQRLVGTTSHLAAFCPFASRVAYECWLVPRRPAARFEEQSDEQLHELAELLAAVLTQLEQTVSCSAYNLLLHTAPFDSSSAEHYHWRMEILPRVTKLAGFEWATGCYINPVLPEDAARKLRLSRTAG